MRTGSAIAILFPALVASKLAIAGEQASIASQSLAQLRGAHKYTASTVSPQDQVAQATADSPLIQLTAFTVVESMYARDLDKAMRAEAKKLEDSKHMFINAHDLASTDIGPVRASIPFEAVSGNGIRFNLLKLSW